MNLVNFRSRMAAFCLITLGILITAGCGGGDSSNSSNNNDGGQIKPPAGPSVLVDIRTEPAVLEIPKGYAKKFEIYGIYSDGSEHKLDNPFSIIPSSNGVVDENNGIISGVSDGSAEIGVEITINGHTFTTQMQVSVVPALPLHKVTIDPSLLAIAPGEKHHINAIGEFQDGSKIDLLLNVEWSTANSTIASVSHDNSKGEGLLEGIKEGNTTLTARYNGIDSQPIPVSVNNIQVKGSLAAFTAIKPNGQVVSWGNPNYGGYNYHVQHQFDSPKEIASAQFGFAVINNDNSLVTWGSFLDEITPPTHVTKIFSRQTGWSFAAFKPDGSVASWGHPAYGGSSAGVDLSNIVDISPASWAFAGLKQDGTVVVWGHPNQGGSVDSQTAAQLKQVDKIFASNWSFAALKSDGTVVTWGDEEDGGDSSKVQDQLTHVSSIVASSAAFTALKTDGSIVSWGNSCPSLPHTCPIQMSDITEVKQVFSNNNAFAALKTDGTVVTWGDHETGGDSSYVQEQLTNVKTIYSTATAFAALKDDGTLVTWGNPTAGGDSTHVQSQITNIAEVYSTWTAFAVLKTDGTVVTWGDPIEGGDTSEVEHQLTNIVKIYSNWSAFAALTSDSRIITWGHPNEGGDSSLVDFD